LLRNADVHLPRIDRNEPLANQAGGFVQAVLDGAAVRSGVREATAVVAVLEAATHSLRADGAFCPVPALPREQVAAIEPTIQAVVKQRSADISLSGLAAVGQESLGFEAVSTRV
jgi:hypothetical protein